ncbi:MAG: hypothetical protein E7108_01870 [Bacteroidales bacterium]|jgi:hypothetical protein|nr:hypothetical protein [Bacteroidales bacterium]
MKTVFDYKPSLYDLTVADIRSYDFYNGLPYLSFEEEDKIFDFPHKVKEYLSVTSEKDRTFHLWKMFVYRGYRFKSLKWWEMALDLEKTAFGRDYNRVYSFEECIHLEKVCYCIWKYLTGRTKFKGMAFYDGWEDNYLPEIEKMSK